LFSLSLFLAIEQVELLIIPVDMGHSILTLKITLIGQDIKIEGLINFFGIGKPDFSTFLF